MHLAHEICKIKHLFIVYISVVVRCWSQEKNIYIFSYKYIFFEGLGLDYICTLFSSLVSQDQSGTQMIGYH